MSETPTKTPELGLKIDASESKRRRGASSYAGEAFMRPLGFAINLVMHGPGAAAYFVSNREATTGLLEGAVLGSRVGIPAPDSDRLIYRRSEPASWLAYDFRRPATFPTSVSRKDFKVLTEGGLASYLPAELANNSADTMTGINDFNYFALEHLLTASRPTMDQLINRGLMIATTHADAYARLGLHHYISQLKSMSIADDTVYQVTPKGNTLTFLEDEVFGEHLDQNAGSDAYRLPGRMS